MVKCRSRRDEHAGETKSTARSLWDKENQAMMIFMLAAAMTVAMLIATVFGLHQEAERVRVDNRHRAYRFGRRD